MSRNSLWDTVHGFKTRVVDDVKEAVSLTKPVNLPNESGEIRTFTMQPSISSEERPEQETEPSLTYDCLSATVPFERMYQSKERTNYPFQDICSFPEDNIIIEHFPKQNLEQAGKDIDVSQLDPFVQVCFETFSADWVLVRTDVLSYERVSSGNPVQSRDLPIFEGDSETDLVRPNGDHRDQKAIKYEILQDPANPLSEDDLYFKMNEERDKDFIHEAERPENQMPIIECFDPAYEWHPGTEIALCNRIRKTLRPDTKHEQHKPFYFSVEPKSVIFQLGAHEPFFCNLALYDIATNKKISENFFFHCNTPSHLALLDKHLVLPEEDIDIKTAVFSVRRRTANIYLVLQIQKILHGDAETSIEPYAKIALSSKQKDIERLQGRIKNDAVEYCARYGKYKQPFAISALQVFDNKGNLLLNEKSEFTNIYARSIREDIFTILPSITGVNDPTGKEAKKFRDLRGMASIVVKKIPDISAYKVLDSSFRVIHEGSEGSLLSVHEFLQQPRLLPNFSYVNNLYIRPLSSNLGKLTAKTVCVKFEVRENDTFDTPAIRCIYSPTQPTGFVDKIFSTVEYHSKCPGFDEFKICLPPKLSTKHHILCTFLDIPLSKTGKKKESTPNIAGYAIIPLYANGRIVTNNSETYHSVPVMGKLELSDYLSKTSFDANATKASFHVQIELESTIFPDDENVTDFLNLYSASQEEVSDKELIAAMKQLQHLKEKTAIQYLPVIINSLLEVMCSREDHTIQLEAFRSLVIVLHKVTSKLKEKILRNSLLELYTNYLFNQTSTGKSVYNQICSNFLLYMMDKKYQTDAEVDGDSIFLNSWFFFDLVIKSMVLQLQAENKLNQDDRTAMFDDIFARTLSRLLVNLTKYFKEHMFKSQSIRVLNKNLALFMKDLLDVIDRGIVLDMIRSYLTEMTDPALKEDKAIIMCATYKFELLRIITDHESFIPLNLPFRPLTSLRLSDLTSLYPIAFTVIFEVTHALSSPKEEIWEMAIGTLYDVIIKNAFDKRFADLERKTIISNIFFVLIPLLLDNWNGISTWRAKASCALKRELYICILYIFENMNQDLICEWLAGEAPHIQVSFLRLHSDMIRAFYYDSSLVRPSKTLLTPQVALFMKQAGTEEMNNLLKGSTNVKVDSQDEEKRLRWLSIRTDISLLSILEKYLNSIKDTILNGTGNSFVFSGIVDCYCALALGTQNEYSTPAIYAKLYHFIRTYRKLIFSDDTEYLRKILRHIILHCNSSASFTYIRATALLYSIFQLNQRTIGNISRARIQTVNTLSDLVASRTLTKDLTLNHSFRRLVSYSIHSYTQLDIKTLVSTKNLSNNYSCPEEILAEFTRNIQEIVLTLASILRDTLRVAQLPDDGEPHMKMDLYYQIADGYKNSPDLRIAWLKDLASLHVKNEGFVEAGMAHLHCAIIIADYLLATEKIDKALISWDILLSVFPIPQEFGEAPEDGVCQSKAFSLEGLISELVSTAKHFAEGEYYEYAAQIYKVVCPILEHTCAYKELAEAHAHLQSCWQAVHEKNTERLFGKYFRIGFYGKKFGDTNGFQFIYKEPKLTHILEMSERIKTFYEKQIGEDIFTLDSSKSLDTIDKDKCYLQITHIEPFRQNGEPTTNFFLMNTKLSKFVYETPFTMSGKAHAEHVSDQYKRKTVLVVTESFPHLLCRLPVASKYDIIVSPIENAIEDIEKRNAILESEIATRNPKTLRQVLQGSVRLQVNEGAVAVCKIFLGSYKDHPKQHVLKLCESIGTFLNLCRVALALNVSFIRTDDDKAFHQAMESGFGELAPEITSLLKGVVYDEKEAEEASDSTPKTPTAVSFGETPLTKEDVTLRPRRKLANKGHRRSRSAGGLHEIIKPRELITDSKEEISPSKIAKPKMASKNPVPLQRAHSKTIVSVAEQVAPIQKSVSMDRSSLERVPSDSPPKSFIRSPEPPRIGGLISPRVRASTISDVSAPDFTNDSKAPKVKLRRKFVPPVPPRRKSSTPEPPEP